ncbi:hypothetical protein JT358_13190 [Micrococcales bacterium 31B]|nr:hypothetical protein [Micrococcales bacterium 31B]
MQRWHSRLRSVAARLRRAGAEANAAPERPTPAARLRDWAISGAVFVVAVALGVGLAGGTRAYLTVRANIANATITAGSLNLLVNNAENVTLATESLAPLKPYVVPLTISNVGTTGANLRATSVATSTTAITANATMRITPVATPAQCVAGLAGPQFALGAYSQPLGVLAGGASGVYCVEVGLLASTPTSQSGQGVNFTITFAGDQAAGT